MHLLEEKQTGIRGARHTRLKSHKSSVQPQVHDAGILIHSACTMPTKDVFVPPSAHLPNAYVGYNSVQFTTTQIKLAVMLCTPGSKPSTGPHARGDTAFLAHFLGWHAKRARLRYHLQNEGLHTGAEWRVKCTFPVELIARMQARGILPPLPPSLPILTAGGKSAPPGGFCTAWRPWRGPRWWGRPHPRPPLPASRPSAAAWRPHSASAPAPAFTHVISIASHTTDPGCVKPAPRGLGFRGGGGEGSVEANVSAT